MRSMMVKILLIYLMSGCDKANGRCRSAKGTCPNDWHQWGDNCYKVIEKRPWSEARDECVRIGGVMAAPNTLDEDAHILKLTSVKTWINCNDLETEGKLQNCQFKSYTFKSNTFTYEKDLAIVSIHEDGLLCYFLLILHVHSSIDKMYIDCNMYSDKARLLANINNWPFPIFKEVKINNMLYHFIITQPKVKYCKK